MITWFRNLKIGCKLILGFVTVSIIAGAIGFIGVRHIMILDQSATDMYQDHTEPLSYLDTAHIAYQQTQVNLLYYVVDPQNKEDYRQRIEGYYSIIATSFATYEKQALAPSERAQYNKVQELLDAYRKQERQIIDLADSGRSDEVTRRIASDLRPAAAETTEAFNRLFNTNNVQAKTAIYQNHLSASGSIAFMIILALVGMIAAVGLGIFNSELIRRPMKELTHAADRLAAGDINVRIAAKSKDETGVLMEAFRRMADSIGVKTKFAQEIAAGNLLADLAAGSKDDVLADSMITVARTLRDLIAETDKLTRAARDGELQARGDAERFTGDYRRVVEGINQTLEAVVVPLQTAAEYIERIGQGTIPEPITESYQGDFNQLKNSINACIDGLGALTESNSVLQNMALNDYTLKVEGAYRGVYGEITLAINRVREQLLEVQRVSANLSHGLLDDLEPMKQLGARSEADQLTPSFVAMMESIRGLVDESLRLSRAAIAGELQARGDAERLDGDYRRVIEGFNQTLDAIVGPLDDAQQVLRRMAVNDYTLAMDLERYQGMFRQFATEVNTVRTRLLDLQDLLEEIAQGETGRLEANLQIGQRSGDDRLTPAITATMRTIQDLIDEVDRLTRAAIRGELTVRGNPDQFQGGFRQIVAGFNQTLDAVIEPVDEASAVLQEMAGGNLGVQVSGDYQGDHAMLAEAVNLTIASFNEVLNEFYGAANQVAAGATHLSDASQALSGAATEQASTVQEISAAMAEIAAQTKQNAAGAGQASQLASAAKDVALQGNQRMREMLAAMADIREASANIAKIIKVIDEIAFQTNILALNAAVEAARAGQHGKGFAVVAEEVRNLASRSAQAAQETAALIEGSGQKVDAGAAIAEQTASALNRIVDEVTKAAALVEDIAAASNEQATGIAQVNQGIQQVGQVTQTNNATAEQSAAASQELSGQAETLKSLVRMFRLKDSGRLTQK